MKITSVVCTFDPYKGGMGNTAKNFIQALNYNRYKFTILTPQYSINDLILENKNNFQIKRLTPFIKMGNASVLPDLWNELDQATIVHFHYPFFGSDWIVLAWKIFKGKDKKLILHYHMDVFLPGLKNLIALISRFFILPFLIKKSDCIIVSSFDYLKNSFIKKYFKLYPDKFKEISFGVNLEKFKPIKFQASFKKNILFVGGLDKAHYFKGLNIFIKALSLLKGDDWQVWITGEGDLKNKYQKIAKNLNLENKIKFTGKINQEKLIKLYQSSDIFVLPSINRSEAFGLVLLEAMACGVPVIASDLPGVRTVFNHGQQGLLCKPNDINDLFGKIQILLTDESLRKKMGIKARKLAEEKYDWLKIGKQLEKIYLNL